MTENSDQIEIPAGLIEDTTEHNISTLSNCFDDDAFQRYLVFDYLGIPDTERLVASTNKRAFSDLIPAIVADGGIPITLPGSAITSVWKLETFTGKNEGVDEHAPRVLQQLEELYTKARTRVITPPRQILHLLLIGNDRASVSGDGPKPSIGAVVKPMLAMAKERGWLACLEATTARARDVYEHYGFEVIEEGRVGKGEVDGRGYKVDGGEGIPIWAMVYGL
ncbi:hypothetical protein DE146DRAFT_681422 [Phaeosphaeria sp. MPI-PUGE-AT-0046c]|nr:hypothetical protein DE146DRAFT_681422 [Phaeosphaeria sp. MPI-PUGE-AT-0046c]